MLDTAPLDLPTAALPGRVVGTWDPHLAPVDGHWHLAFVAARKFFDFYPALARATEPGRLDGWELLGAATDRRGTEGPQLRRLDGQLAGAGQRRRRQPPRAAASGSRCST